MKATDFCKYFDFTLWVNDTNEKAKSDLELVKGRAEEIYAEFDNN